MCFNNIFTISLQYVRKARGYKYFYNMFARLVAHNNFHNFASPFLFFLFGLQYTYAGEDGGTGLTFISSLQFFYYAISLSASNWGYLYFSLLWQGNSFHSLYFWEREGDWGYLYC